MRRLLLLVISVVLLTACTQAEPSTIYRDLPFDLTVYQDRVFVINMMNGCVYGLEYKTAKKFALLGCVSAEKMLR